MIMSGAINNITFIFLSSKALNFSEVFWLLQVWRQQWRGFRFGKVHIMLSIGNNNGGLMHWLRCMLQGAWELHCFMLPYFCIGSVQIRIECDCICIIIGKYTIMWVLYHSIGNSSLIVHIPFTPCNFSLGGLIIVGHLCKIKRLIWSCDIIRTNSNAGWYSIGFNKY